jgi:uncharacterized repeat protein (TIGR01451 family)
VNTTATVTAPGDTVDSNDSAQASTPVTMIDLAVSMQHSGTFGVNALSTFTVNVENAGTTATITPSKLVDTLPAGLTFSSATGIGWSCSASGQVVTCLHAASVGPSEAAAPVTINVTPQASAGGQQVTNTATVSTKDDAESSNDTATDTATVGAAPVQQVQGQTGSSKCKKKKPKKGKKAKKCKKKKKKKK